MKKVLYLLLALVLMFTLVACAENTPADDTAEETTVETEAEGETTEETEAEAPVEESTEETESEAPAEGTEVTLRRAYTAPHGDKSFGRFVVALVDGKIIAVSIDEFQFGDAAGDNTFVPNSDGAFAEGYAEGKALYSKVVNSESYSANMAEKAGSTVALTESYKAIEEFAIGKTVEELEAALSENPTDKPWDAISGATLVDTHGYVNGIVEAAKNEVGQVVATTSEDLANAELKVTLGAPHGDKSFGEAAVLVSNDKIVAANLDEFQFMADVTGVPNSDGAFAESYAEGKVLASKLVNDESYSANMAEKAGSTVTWAENVLAIENFVAGKTVAEVEETIAANPIGKPVDAISGATFVDGTGYLQLIVDATK